MKKNYLLASVLVFLCCGCAWMMPVNMGTENPIDANDVTYHDIKLAVKKNLDNLLSQDILKNKDGERPLIMVDSFDNTLFPHINTDLLAQDVRLAILISDKGITMPAPVKKNGKIDKKLMAEKLKKFDFFLSGQIMKKKANVSKVGDKDVFSVCFKLKDLKTGLVIWESSEVLSR